MDFSKLTTNNWIAGGGGIVMVIAAFLPWFSFGPFTQSGFNSGIVAVLGIFLTIAGATILLMKVLDIQDIAINNLPAEQVSMVVAALGAVFVLLRVLFAPSSGSGFAEVTIGRSLWGWVALLASIAVVAGAYLSAQDKGIGIPSADDLKDGMGGIGGGGSDEPPSTF